MRRVERRYAGPGKLRFLIGVKNPLPIDRPRPPENAAPCGAPLALLVAGIDELEEEIATTVHDRQVADFIDDEQRRAAEPADTLAQLTLALSLGEGADDVGERGEVDAAPRLDGFDAESRSGFTTKPVICTAAAR
jgi:hypothetical protein